MAMAKSKVAMKHVLQASSPLERVQRGEAVIALSEASNLCEQAKNKDAELGKKAAAFYTEMSKSACCGCSGEFAQAPITIEDE